MSYRNLRSYREFPAEQWDGLLRPAVDVKPTAADVWKAFQSCLKGEAAAGIVFTFKGKRSRLDFEEFFTERIEPSGLPCSLEGFYGLADQHVTYLAACGEFFDSEKENAKYAACTGSTVVDAFCNDPAQGVNGIPPTIYEVYDTEKGCLTDRFVKFMTEYTAQSHDKPEKKTTKKLKGKKVEKFAFTNDKASKLLPNYTADELAEGIDLYTIKNTSYALKNGPVPINVKLLSYDDPSAKFLISQGRTLTRYDRMVCDAVTTLFLYGDPSHHVTVDQIWHTMTGGDKNQKPGSEQRRSIVDSVDKMRKSLLLLDYSEEAKARKLARNGKPVTGFRVEAQMISADKVEVVAGGHKTEAYVLKSPPALYQYVDSVSSKQLITVDAKLLAIREVDSNGEISDKGVPNTFCNLLVREHLMRRIEDMKGGLNNKNIALFSYEKDGVHNVGIYEAAETGVCTIDDLSDATKRLECKRVRDYCEKVLTYWKACGYIRDFEFVKDGRSFKNIRIDL